MSHPTPVQRALELVMISPPPPEQRVARDARFAAEGQRKGRYELPTALHSPSPVGYRVRPSLTREEATDALKLLSLEPPATFVAGSTPPTEQELFEESSLGVLSARQSTNYRGHRQVTLGPQDSATLYGLLQKLEGLHTEPLTHATHTHVILARPYRTPFTFLLTFVGHEPLKSLLTVPRRALEKQTRHSDDIPTINYLRHMHLGILADAMERAAVIASSGARQANVLMAPFCGELGALNADVMRQIEALVELSATDRLRGWRVALVAQVGQVAEAQRVALPHETCRKLGATLLSLRSERIQPGINQEERAPSPYQQRQEMDVPEALTVMCGRAAYNAFARWTGCDREASKELLLMERVDVLTPHGKERLRAVRAQLDGVTDRVMKNIPLWADLPTGRALSRNAARGKKAFGLAGQRIYIGGLDRTLLAQHQIDWELAVRAFGAASSRSALFAELMGCVELPEGCDLLAGICLMAGPVNQNDIGKSFYGQRDLLGEAFPKRDPTSLLMWTLKAKTVADPIGNEEQLLDAARKGALVDLRPGPHEVIAIKRLGALEPMRQREARVNTERAFADQQNFVTDAQGRHIPGNQGAPWPEAWSKECLW